MSPTATANANATSGRIGKTVTGVARVVGNGFSGLRFSEEMFDGRMDPLLVVDHFVMTSPTFEPRLHTGISAVTAMFEDSEGRFLNRDTLGHNIVLKGGDLYWLAAASGAVHEVRPQDGGRTHALQIFVDLPARLKTEPARALHVHAEDAPVIDGKGHRVRVLVGRCGKTVGEEGTPEEMTMLDGFLEQQGRFTHPMPDERQAWIYAVAGELDIRIEREERPLKAGSATTIAAGAATDIVLQASEPAHFVLMAARPIR